jgi:Ca-activated chloride channel family protein
MADQKRADFHTKYPLGAGSHTRRVLLFLMFICIMTASLPAMAQVPAKNPYRPTRVLFLLDASGSMRGKWQDSDKWNTAKVILKQMTDSLRRENIEFALRVFGHQSDRSLNDCNDTRLEIPFSRNNYAQLLPKLTSIEPKGYSPIALSIEKAVGDFPMTTDSKNIIILITDGFENCSGDPCTASEKLQAAGIFLRPYIVGLGLSEDQKIQFDCVGEVYDVQENTQVNEVSGVIITNVLNPTTLQLNLLSEGGRPTESNVNMTFSETGTKQIRYNIIHTMNAAGNPDTLFIDPSRSYDVKVHTLPPVRISNIQLTQGKHTTRATDAAQGSLKLSMPGAMRYKSLKCIVRKNGTTGILNVQDINTSVSYLTGEYDLEILTLPPIVMNDVAITQSQVKTITVVSPGTLNISKQKAGYLFISRNVNGVMEQVYTMDVNTLKETILLQPGNYEIMYRLKSAQSSKSSVIKKISVTSGLANSITF